MIENSSYEILNERYSHQTQWTRQFREFIYRKLPESGDVYILEIGCGTGAVIRRVKDEYKNPNKVVFGIDISYKITNYAKFRDSAIYINGDGAELPFEDDVFDLVFCHYLLLWTENPVKIIKEMRRVLKHQGIAAAIAEPCYKEMTASPDSLRNLAEEQRQKLQKSGSNINIGCELGNLFRKAGFQNVQSGPYQTGNMDSDYIQQEISQMLVDTDRKQFQFETNTEYSYSVPTYYSFAIK